MYGRRFKATVLDSIWDGNWVCPSNYVDIMMSVRESVSCLMLLVAVVDLYFGILFFFRYLPHVGMLYPSGGLQKHSWKLQRRSK